MSLLQINIAYRGYVASVPAWINLPALVQPVAETLNCTAIAAGIGTGTVQIADDSGAFHVALGTPILIQLTSPGGGSANAYIGYVNDASEHLLTTVSGTNIITLQMSHQMIVFSKRTVNKLYLSQTVDAVVLDVVTTVMAADGITIGHIDVGPLMDRIVLGPRMMVNNALNQLAAIYGAHWYITSDGKFYMYTTYLANYQSVANATPNGGRVGSKLRPNIVLDDGEGPHAWAKHPLEGYCNVTWGEGSSDITSQQVEIRGCDGNTSTFTMTYPIMFGPYTDNLGNAAPKVELNTGGGYVTQTLGVSGQVVSGVQTTWLKGDPHISFITGNGITAQPAPPANTALVKVTYSGKYPIEVQSVNQIEQQRMAQIDAGNSGYYESVVNFQDSETYSQAQLMGNANNNSNLPRDFLTFDTDYDEISQLMAPNQPNGYACWWQPGQLIGCNFPEHNIVGPTVAGVVTDEPMWISQVQFQDKQQVPVANHVINGHALPFPTLAAGDYDFHLIRWNVQCVSNLGQQLYQAYLAQMISQGRYTRSLNENAVIFYQQNFAEKVNIAEAWTLTQVSQVNGAYVDVAIIDLDEVF